MNSKYYKKNHYKYKGKIIDQYDKDTKIKEWKNIKEILKENPKYTYSNMMRCINNNKIAYGYYWKYKNDDKIEVIEDEVFKNIGIFDKNDFSNYEISNYGNVRHVKRRNKYLSKRILRQYYNVTLFNKNKRGISVRVHRLVAYKFVKGRTDVNNIVNHIDENKLNNHYENLEWTTIKKNTIHSIGRKVEQIDTKTGEVINTFDTITDAYKHFDKPCNSHISRCCNGLALTALGYKWKYIK